MLLRIQVKVSYHKDKAKLIQSYCNQFCGRYVLIFIGRKSARYVLEKYFHAIVYWFQTYLLDKS